MHVQITHLKAPWPLGAVVGDVLDLPSIPVWAVGKCVQVEDDVELTIVTGDGTGEALPPVATSEGEGASVFVLDQAAGAGLRNTLPVINQSAPVKAKKK